MTDQGHIKRCNALGIGISAVNMNTALQAIRDALHARRKGYVCVQGAHGIIEAQRDKDLRQVFNHSFLTVPDGMPTVLMGRAQGLPEMRRVYGPDLMLELCRLSLAEGWTHFLYGGKAGVADELADALRARFPGIRIVGTFCPPFRPLNDQEQGELERQVAAARPDIFWVGLSTPKQDRFMAAQLDRLDTCIMLGVGAAFDQHTGRMRDAPRWMKACCLQWLHRLVQEPRRLSKRYVYVVPVFLWLVMLQALRIRRYDVT